MADEPVRQQRPLLRDGTRVGHLMLVAVMAWWCIDLARPVDTFGSSPSYRWFAETWPHSENGWAVAFGLAAVVGLAGLFARNRYARLASVVLLAGAHFNLAYGSYQGNGAGTGSGTYGILAVFALWRIWAEETQ